VHLERIAIVVHDYDTAIDFFVNALGFELLEDSPTTTNDGRAKRWVVVAPPGGQTGIVLAQADGPAQRDVIGAQTAGRVGFFLRVDDFDASYERMQAAGVEFVSAPRDEPYGRVTIFVDVAGNKWDMLGPPRSIG
jgi:catechol 2,3-dioxygenase-like lactoylglutathione lyase family enzyme